MDINLNGKTKQISPGTTVAALLQQLRIDPSRVVVEHNAVILPKQAYDDITLADGDTLEIVHFVGGG